MAEEDARAKNQPLDEHSTNHVWDDFTEKQFHELSIEASDMFTAATKKRWWQAFKDGVLGGFRPLYAAAWLLRWLLVTIVTGFVSTLGVIACGALILWGVPSINKMARSAFDDAFPSEKNSSPSPAPSHAPTGAPAKR